MANIPFDFYPPNTGTSLATMSPNSVRKLWHQGLLVAEQSTDFWQQMETSSDKSPIWSITDTSKGRGQSITFTTMSGFYNEPHYNDQMFEGPDDFEQIQIGDFNLTVDYIRNAVSTNERMEELMGMRSEIANKINIELGKWLGRAKSDAMFGTIQLKLPTANVLYASGKTLDTLSSADTLDWNEIVTAGQAMKPLGGMPANVSKRGMAPIWSETVVASEVALTSLKVDPDYKTILASGDVRGKGNTLFAGGYPDIDGHTIVPYNPIDHDGVGAVGSFINQKAFLGTAVAAGTTAIDITGGGSSVNGALTKKLYFKYFGGYNYIFTDGAFTATTPTRYFLIYNLTGADAGKAGMYSYTTGNNGNKITIVNRLAAAASGAAVTTLGAVTWNTGVWANKHTDAHPSGSLIIPCNAKGVPIGDTIFLGRSAIVRGYGKHRGHRTQELVDGEFVTRRYITSVFGQSLRRDRLNRVPAVIRLTHAINYPGVNLPVVP